MGRNILRALRDFILLNLLAFGSLVSIFYASPAQARITKIVVLKTVSPAFGGASFGPVGQYEQLDGIAYGEVDPRTPLNAIIQDIALAPRNDRGMVEYSMDISILKPIDMDHSNHTILYDVVNRGAPRVPTNFNILAPGAAQPGDGFLQSHGYTIVSSGWQGDLLPGGARLTIKVPVARGPGGAPITGRVLTEINPQEPANTRLISGIPFTASYEPVTLDNSTAVLTARVHQDDPRVTIPNSEWAFADCTKVSFPGAASSKTICIKGGFDANHIYELVYDAKNPLVLGLGFAAIRDLVAFLRRNESSVQNPLAGAIRVTLMHGTSQSGRMARGFLSLGFNQDEDGRDVFDGMNPHVAAGRIALNIRFAQPGRGAGLQHAEHQFPSGELPLTWVATTNPVTQRREGLLDRCSATNTCPKIIQTVTDNEYWQGPMSTSTSDVENSRELPIPDNVRIFHFASTQHLGSQPNAVPSKGICQMVSNPNSYNYNMRALLSALRDWVVDGKEPPPSHYPTLAAGTLVAPASLNFARIPGLQFAALYSRQSQYDRGPQFNSTDISGIVTERSIAIRDSVVLVPKIDEDGNDVDGVRSVALQAPLGTYLGWNLRAAGHSEGDLCGNTGAFIPFASSKAERLTFGDSRRSLEERYGSHEGYVAAVKKAAESLVQRRLMLSEDVVGAVAIANASKVLQ